MKSLWFDHDLASKKPPVNDQRCAGDKGSVITCKIERRRSDLLDRYAHVTMAMQRAAADLLDAIPPRKKRCPKSSVTK